MLVIAFIIAGQLVKWNFTSFSFANILLCSSSRLRKKRLFMKSQSEMKWSIPPLSRYSIIWFTTKLASKDFVLSSILNHVGVGIEDNRIVISRGSNILWCNEGRRLLTFHFLSIENYLQTLDIRNTPGPYRPHYSDCSWSSNDVEKSAQVTKLVVWT